MGVAENPGDPASQGAQARWYDIQRRADDLNQTLYGLREAARDPGDQARIEDVLASLQAVRSAMDAERAPGAYIGQQSDVVRSRLYAFESSLQALRAGDPRYSYGRQSDPVPGRAWHRANWLWARSVGLLRRACS